MTALDPETMRRLVLLRIEVLRHYEPDSCIVTSRCVVDYLRSHGRLDAVREKHPGYTISPTGLSVIAARNSAGMINKLNHGLTLEFAFIAAFIGLASRNTAYNAETPRVLSQ